MHECLAFRLPLEQVVIKSSHEDLRGIIRHLPEAHDECLRASLLETALQSEDTLALGDVAFSCFAGGEHHEVKAAEVESRDFLCGEYAVVGLHGQVLSLQGKVGTGEEQSAAGEGPVLGVCGSLSLVTHDEESHLLLPLGLFLREVETVCGDMEDFWLGAAYHLHLCLRGIVSHAERGGPVFVVERPFYVLHFGLRPRQFLESCLRPSYVETVDECAVEGNGYLPRP